MALVGSDAQQVMAAAKSAYFITDILLFFGRALRIDQPLGIWEQGGKVRVTGSPDSAAAGLSFGHHKGEELIRSLESIVRADCYQVGSVSIVGGKAPIGEVLREWTINKQLSQFSGPGGGGPDVATMTVDGDDSSSL
jgi:hypothetical protein